MTLIRNALLLTTLLSSSIVSPADAAEGIVINEVAYQGTGDDVCNGRDWVELANTNGSGDDVDLTGYVLHDDNGAMDEDAEILGTNSTTTIASQGFLVMCRGTDFDFGIGSSDTITLLDASGSVVDSVSLMGGGDGSTFARIDGGGGGEFQYTTAATPGAANILEEPVPLEEVLASSYAAGAAFFGKDDDYDDFGDFGGVIDINVEVDDESLAIIRDHPAWEEYVAFADLSVTTSSGASEGFSSEKDVVSSGAGRIRVKGQSTNTIAACLGVRNVPFNIEFQTPFFGMEQMYLRNHLWDPSYMRDAAAHYMLQAVGLPFSRTKPARLFMNGEYVGFYTLMDAPTQGHVLQQSLGPFDPEKTGIFKMKTALNQCPVDTTVFGMDSDAADDPGPDTYYFERGRHKADTPVLGLEQIDACEQFFFSEISREMTDLGRGYENHNKDCAETMVELGRVDRDYGPKSLEDSMKNFLEKYYDQDVDDLNDYIDTDDWLRNFAFMSLTLHQDSPIGLINNWYLATNNGGEDWKIVQYDHNNFATSTIATLVCGLNCAPGLVYWPILRPTCGPVEDHVIAGRVLNSPENIEKYVSYVSEYVEILSSDEVLGRIKAHGELIKEYVIDDPLNLWFETVEEYETQELGEDTSDYNQGEEQPMYKIIRVRFEEVRKQIEAIEAGTLPGGGEYDSRANCPDWRDPNGGFVPSGSTVGENCLIPDCAAAGQCYDNSPLFCSEDGEMAFEACKAASPLCDSCFPYSRCGSNLYADKSPTFVESASCGPELAECREASQCFSHSTGICDFTGTILTVDCQVALPACIPCYPYSRCGSGELVEDAVLPELPSAPVVQDDSGVYVESDACTPEFAELGCAEGAICFDHAMGICLEDGTFSIPDCDLAAPCAPCFPNSRCGSLVQDTSGVLVESDDACPPEVAAMGCADGAPCFNHAMGICQEDGTFSIPDCDLAAPCAPCFPNSRCGSLEVASDDEEEEVVADDEEEEKPADDEGEEPEPKQPDLEGESSESISSGPATRGIVVARWLALLSALWGMVIA